MTLLDTCPVRSGEARFESRALSLGEALRRFEHEAVPGVCDTGRYRCRYYAWGQGPPLIFIPGLSDDALSFVMPCALLADHFRCVAYSLPEGGPDGARLARYTHADLAGDLLALLDHLGLGRSYLFGSSFGSTVVLAALARHPDRLPRAVLQGGFARRPLGTPALLLAGFARYWPGRAAWLPFRQAMLRRLHHAPFAGRELEVWEFFLTRWGAPPVAAVAYRARLLHRLDLRPLLPRVRQPVLLVCGESDPLVGKTCEEELLHGLPNVGRVELSRAGHTPVFTHPEVLAEVVRQFLTPRA